MIDPLARLYHGGRRRSTRRLRNALVSALAAALACDASGPTAPPEPGPPRIVALGVELGRLLVELGVGPGAVGVDSGSRAIPELAHALDLGDAAAPSVALARGLRPELVLVLAEPSEPAAAFAAALASDGIPAHLLAPRDANEVIATIHRVGRLVGRDLRATAVAARVTREVSAIATRRDGRSRLKVAWVLERDPLVVVGASGMLHEILELAGAENAFHTPQRDRLVVAPAELVASAPDVVLAPASAAGVLPGTTHVAVDASLAELPLLDLHVRVRALHAALYPPPGLRPPSAGARPGAASRPGAL